jgi:excisionase family DNA binding protein
VSLPRVSDRSEGVSTLPPADVVDTLGPEALVNVATQAAALHARAMARLALLGAQAPCPDATAAEQYVDASQVAAWLQLPKPRVYALIRSGDLPAIAFGKYKRVHISDLRAWAAKHRVEGMEYLQRRPQSGSTGKPLRGRLNGGASQGTRREVPHPESSERPSSDTQADANTRIESEGRPHGVHPKATR